MVQIGPDEIINLIVAGIILIPAILLYNSYRITKIADFLLFSGVFVVSTIGAIASVLISINELLIFYQINVGMLNVTFLLLFIHGLRIKYKSFRKAMIPSLIGIGYFVFLSLLMLFWEVQTQPDRAFVIFTEMDHSAAPAHPNGAGLRFGDNIIYSTSYYLIGLIFWIFSLVYLVYAYVTVDVVNPTENITRARKLWIIAWSFDLLWSISLLPIFPQFPEINVILIFVNLLIVYILLKYPESTMISDDQIIRYQGLYDRIIDMGDDKEAPYGMTSLLDYLNSLPDDLRKN